MEFLAANWKEIALGLTGLVTGASVLLKLLAPYTSSKADDKVAGALDKVVAVLKKLSLNTGN